MMMMMDENEERKRRESYGLEPERKPIGGPTEDPREVEEEIAGGAEGAALPDDAELGPEMITGEPRWPVGSPVGETAKTGGAPSAADRDQPRAAPPVEKPALARPLPGDPWGPRVLAILALGVLVVAWLAGLHALTPEIVADEFGDLAPVSWGRRFAGLLRLPLLVGFWTVCAYAAVFMVATLRERPIGDALRLGERLLAATLLARLTTFIDVSNQGMERSIEIITQLGVFWLVLLALLRVNWRDAAIVLGLTGAVFFAVVGASYVIQWTAV